jgi:gliding motility-associated-like protein
MRTRRMKKALTTFLSVFCLHSGMAFNLPKEAVHPRIFTPNGDGINDVVTFYVGNFVVNPMQETLEGRIYDREGAVVADIQLPQFADGTWDGRDRNGNMARAGVYIYEISSGSQRVTGTVVVAK